MDGTLENAAPKVYQVKERTREIAASAYDENVEEPIDAAEIFDYIRDINDPEHPYSLEQLNVVQEKLIGVERRSEKVTSVAWRTLLIWQRIILRIPTS